LAVLVVSVGVGEVWASTSPYAQAILDDNPIGY